MRYFKLKLHKKPRIFDNSNSQFQNIYINKFEKLPNYAYLYFFKYNPATVDLNKIIIIHLI